MSKTAISKSVRDAAIVEALQGGQTVEAISSYFHVSVRFVGLVGRRA